MRLLERFRPNNPRGLHAFDDGEPARCAVVVVSRLNPVRFDGGDIPSATGIERGSQLFLTDGVLAGTGTLSRSVNRHRTIEVHGAKRLRQLVDSLSNVSFVTRRLCAIELVFHHCSSRRYPCIAWRIAVSVA